MRTPVLLATLSLIGLVACGDDPVDTSSSGAGGAAATGAGGDGQGTSVSIGGGPPVDDDVVELAQVDDRVFKGPRSIAVDGTHVFWTNVGSDGFSGVLPGSVTRVPLEGGPVEVLVDLGQDGRAALGLAVDATTIFFTAGGGFVSPDDGAYHAPLNGGAPTQIAEAAISLAMAIDATHVYWGANENVTECCPGVVRRMPKGGGDVEHVATGPSIITDMALDGTHVYWTTSESGAVLRAALGGSEVVELATGLAEPSSLALGGDSVYVVASGGISGDGNALVRVPKEGGAPEVLVEGVLVRAVATDEEHLYWAGYEMLQKIPLAGGDPVVLATEVHLPTDLVVDATHVYVADGPWAAIWKVRKERRARSSGRRARGERLEGV